MANDAGVIDPQRTGTGGGGQLGRRGGGGGNQGDQGGSGNPTQDDFSRLLQILTRIRQSLDLLVHINPPVVPQVLHSQFVRNWPEVDGQFNRATMHLTRRPSPLLRRQLRAAGLTGEMLQMKQTSLNYHLDRLDESVRNYNERPTLTLSVSQKVGVIGRIVKWFKSGSKTMNSVLGSLKFIPGVETVKEFKEHVEAAWDVAETAQEEREL
jgi:hypothetical protein